MPATELDTLLGKLDHGAREIRRRLPTLSAERDPQPNVIAPYDWPAPGLTIGRNSVGRDSIVGARSATCSRAIQRAKIVDKKWTPSRWTLGTL